MSSCRKTESRNFCSTSCMLVERCTPHVLSIKHFTHFMGTSYNAFMVLPHQYFGRNLYLLLLPPDIGFVGCSKIVLTTKEAIYRINWQQFICSTLQQIVDSFKVIDLTAQGSNISPSTNHCCNQCLLRRNS